MACAQDIRAVCRGGIAKTGIKSIQLSIQAACHQRRSRMPGPGGGRQIGDLRREATLAQYGEGVAARYTAEIVEEAGSGTRLRPTDGTAAPTELNEIHLLGLAVALAMGAAGYVHHPQPRDRDITIDALLAGEVAMPWHRPAGRGGSRIVCERSDSAWQCRIEPAAGH